MHDADIDFKLKAAAATAVSPAALAAAVKDLHRIGCEDRLEYVTRFGRDHELTLENLVTPDDRLIGFSNVRVIRTNGRITGFEIEPLTFPDGETDPHLLNGLRMDFADLPDLVRRNRIGEIVEMFSAGSSRRDRRVRKSVFRSLLRALKHTIAAEIALGDAELGLGGDNGVATRVFAREGWRQRDILDELGLPKGFHKLGLQAAGALLYLHGAQGRPRDDMAAGDFAYITADALRHCPDAGFRQKLGIFIAALSRRLTRDDAHAAGVLRWAWLCAEKLKQRGDLKLEEAARIVSYIGAPAQELQAAGIEPFTTEIALATARDRADRWREFRDIRAKNGGASATPYPALDWAPINSQLPNSPILIARIANEEQLYAEAARNHNCAHDCYAQDAAAGYAALYALRRLPTNRDQQQRRFICPILGIEVVNVGMMRLYQAGAGAYSAEARGPTNDTVPARHFAAIESFLAPTGE